MSERPSGTTLKKHKSQPPPPTSSPPGAEICSPLARTGLTAAQRASRRSSSAACCPLCPGTTTPRFAPIRGGSFVPPSNPRAGLAVRTPDWRRYAKRFVRPKPSPRLRLLRVLATDPQAGLAVRNAGLASPQKRTHAKPLPRLCLLRGLACRSSSRIGCPSSDKRLCEAGS